jgi:t-SNARE complex subunit (syntaxin)
MTRTDAAYVPPRSRGEDATLPDDIRAEYANDRRWIASTIERLEEAVARLEDSAARMSAEIASLKAARESKGPLWTVLGLALQVVVLVVFYLTFKARV